MSNNNTPTSPGWWYRHSITPSGAIAYVVERSTGLVYRTLEMKGWKAVEDDGKWRGEVPMPGESSYGDAVFTVFVDDETVTFATNRGRFGGFSGAAPVERNSPRFMEYVIEYLDDMRQLLLQLGKREAP